MATDGFPIIGGAVCAQTVEQKRDLDLLLTPGPVTLPGLTYRDPIRGTNMPSYSRYPQICPPPRKQLSGFHKSVHERSIFVDTQCARSFYVIHPDWTSEAATARRLSVKARGPYAWDHRPSVQPLVNFITPVLEKRKERDELLRQTLAEAKSAHEQRQSQMNAPVDYQGKLSHSLSAIDFRSPPRGTGLSAPQEKYCRNMRDTHNLAYSRMQPQQLVRY